MSLPSLTLAEDAATEDLAHDAEATRERIQKAATATSLSRRGVAYIAARYGCSALVSAGNVLVLTWWIGPRAYGAFVTAVGITTFLASLGRAGLDTHLVRSGKAPTREDYDTAFTLILAISILLCALGGLALPLLTGWLPETSFALPYLVLLLTIPLIGLAGPPLAKLERDLQFQAVAKIEFGGQLSAFVVGAILAWRGLGVWAPVTGHMIWQLFVVFAAKRVSGLSPRLAVDRARARRMIGFGLGFSASVRVWQLRNLVNPLIVGRLLGTEAVAFVALAVRAIEALSFVRTAVGRVAIAALARVREDPARCQHMMQKGARLQLFALGGVFAAMSVLGPPLLPSMLGGRWSSALVVLPFVAAGALINSIFLLEASALFVEGRHWVVTRSYLWHVSILILGTVVLVPALGIAGYGWAELAACVPYAILHRGLQPGLRISLPPILPWLAAFVLAFLSSLLPAPMRWTLWLPLACLSWIEARRWIVQSSLAQQTQLRRSLGSWISATQRRSDASGD
jgi:PST family polysaccharide transporter